MKTTRVTVTAALVAAMAAGVSAQTNWPQFRGGVAGVVADDPALPERWGPDENIAWRIDIPGRAWSSPIVWGDHVFVLTVTRVGGDLDAQPMPIESYRARSLGGSMTGADIVNEGEPLRWVLYDVDFETGAIRWEHELHTAVPSLTAHQKNTFASETPVTDGARVYVYLADIGLFALDFEGNEAWSAPFDWLPRRNWGAAGSPVLHEGRLYVVNDNDDQSWVAAYDAATGERIWRTDRDEGTNWSTPFVWENDVRTELVTTGTGGVRSYSLDGELLWELHGMSSLVIPTPFADHGLLFINSGYIADRNRPVYAIRAGASGDISLGQGSTDNDYVVWSHPQLGSYNPSSLVYGDYHYTLHQLRLHRRQEPAGLRRSRAGASGDISCWGGGAPTTTTLRADASRRRGARQIVRGTRLVAPSSAPTNPSSLVCLHRRLPLHVARDPAASGP